MIPDFLLARISDLCRKAENGCPADSVFLTPEEQSSVSEFLKRNPGDFSWRLFGGYDDAERRKLFLFPTWCAEGDCLSEQTQDIVPIRICGSGYAQLTHRDYLGAVLSLGLKRECIGDIVLENEGCAVVFCDSALLDFFARKPCPLETVGRDHVRVEAPALLRPFPPKQFLELTESVASPRIDCTVAALTHLAREKAQALIVAGEVSVNHREICRTDASVQVGDRVVIRGIGKYEIIAITPKAKGKPFRLSARKFI